MAVSYLQSPSKLATKNLRIFWGVSAATSEFSHLVKNFIVKLFFQCCKGTIFHIFNDFLRLLKNILFLKELIFKCQWGHENWEKCSVVDGKIRVSNVAEKHRLRRRSETADWQNDNRSIKTFIFTQNNDTKGGRRSAEKIPLPQLPSLLSYVSCYSRLERKTHTTWWLLQY